MSDPVSQFIGSIGAWRIVVLVLVGDLILLLGNYFADKAEERRRYATSVQASGWADEGHRIEDLRHEEPIAREPMDKPREAVFDAETGEELTPVRATWRRKPKKKGERGQMETAGDSQLTERNTSTDGGKRTAVTLGGAMEVESATSEADGEPSATEDEHQHAEEEQSSQTQPPEVSEQEAADALAELEAATAEEVADGVPALDPAENRDDETRDENPAEDAERDLPEEIDHHEPRQPEQREDRLLNPPVAAE